MYWYLLFDYKLVAVGTPSIKIQRAEAEKSANVAKALFRR
jgi:hypothetical protein